MRLASLMVAVSVAILAGCNGDSVIRYEVSGAVTYDGAPLPAGRIDFEPDVSQGNQGPAGWAEIKAGRYRTQTGHGIVGGPHIVRISGSDGVPLKLESGDVDPAGRQFFADYTEQVAFPTEATTHDFAVPATASEASP